MINGDIITNKEHIKLYINTLISVVDYNNNKITNIIIISSKLIHDDNAINSLLHLFLCSFFKV